MDNYRFVFVRAGLLSVAALMLASCGNKGPLFLPPAGNAATVKSSPASQPAKPVDHSSAPATKDQ